LKVLEKNYTGFSVRELSTVKESGRFDAEYWQPKYDALLERIRAFDGQITTVGKQFSIIKNNFNPEDDKTYRYIEIGDVSLSNGGVKYTELPTKELPANAKILFGKRQLIASKVRPNRGAVAILNNHNGYVGSGAFTVLREEGSIPLEVLLVYLKTRPIRDLLLRSNIGTSYPVIKDENILELPIPLLDKKTSSQIVNNVIRAQTNLSEASALIDRAKYVIEVFVEKDKNSALKVIKGA
jgi:type I restriction enzyme S subunit